MASKLHILNGGIKKREIKLSTKQYSIHECDHIHFIIDTKLSFVKCADCDADLNPMYVLNLLACNESYYQRLVISIREEQTRLEKRKITKCEHCGRTTKISNSY